MKWAPGRRGRLLTGGFGWLSRRDGTFGSMALAPTTGPHYPLRTDNSKTVRVPISHIHAMTAILASQRLRKARTHKALTLNRLDLLHTAILVYRQSPGLLSQAPLAHQ